MTESNRDLVTSVGEFGLHQWLRHTLKQSPLDVTGVGDDCAVLDCWPDDYLLLTSDRVPLSAYKRSYDYLGKFCVVHNFSDIICKGGRPMGLLLDTFLPRDTALDDWKAIVSGADSWAQRYGGYVLGGDTKESPHLAVVGCAIGRVPKARFLSRAGARSGDLCAITLTGGTRLGVPWAYQVVSTLKVDVEQEYLEWLTQRFYVDNLQLPLEEMMAVSELGGASACVDASDGIGGAIQTLCSSAGVGIQVEYEALKMCIEPTLASLALRLSLDVLKFAFSPGFGWTNVLAVDPDAFPRLQTAVRAKGGDLVRIGQFTTARESIITVEGKRRQINLFFNEGFRGDRDVSNSVSAWLEQKLMS